MRRRTWAVWFLVASALLLGFLGAATDFEAFNIFAGLCWIAAMILGISLLPWWARILPDVPPMPGLFTPPHDGQRWCAACGTPADATRACPVCGARPRPPRQRKNKRVQS